MRRTWAIIVKEFRQIRRDPLSLGLLIVVPAMLLTLYGYALSFDVKDIPLAVLDEDRTALSRQFVDRLFRNAYFRPTGRLESAGAIDAYLARGQARAVIRVPRGFTRELLRGGTAGVQVLVDGADANSANVTIGYLDAMAERASASLAVPGPVRLQVQTEPRLWFNPGLSSGRFLVPGLIGLLLMLSAVIATSLSIVREKERQTIDLLRISPIRSEALILGKTLPYVGIGLLTMALVLALGRWVFGVEIRGSWWLLGATTLVFLFSALGMGLLISALNRSQQVAFQVAILVSLLPSIILSGFIFPIANMPAPIRAVTFIVPPRYFVHALRGIILKDASVSAVWVDLAALALLGTVFNLLAATRMRRED